MNKVIAVVGMAGSGKSVVCDEFVKRGYHYIRFGQITINEVKKRGLAVSEENEKRVREELRTKYGMAAYAILNMETIKESFAIHNVIIDGLYSWSEYKLLKEEFKDNFFVIAVYSPPKMRYERLTDRASNFKDDDNNRFRSINKENAVRRDYSEIENIEKGGPIAMADYTIVNNSGIKHLQDEMEVLFNELQTI